MVITNVALSVLLLIGATSARAQPMDGSDLAEVSLLSEKDAAVAGETLWIAMHFAIEPEWHMYWQNPGDTGEPPSVRWELPKGVTVGDPLWPAPRRYISPGSILDYTFEHELAILYPVQISGEFEAGSTVTISAKTDYLICKSLCLFGKGEASLTLPVRASASTGPSAPVFECTRRFIPKPPAHTAEIGLETSWEGPELVIRVPGASKMAFFPLPDRNGASTRGLIESGQVDGDRLRIAYDDPTKSASVRAVLEIHFKDRRVYQEINVPTER